MEFLQKLIEIIIKKHRQLKKLYRVIFALACVVVFVTSYALTLPAITLERNVANGMPGIVRDSSGKANDLKYADDGSGTESNAGGQDGASGSGGEDSANDSAEQDDAEVANDAGGGEDAAGSADAGNGEDADNSDDAGSEDSGDSGEGAGSEDADTSEESGSSDGSEGMSDDYADGEDGSGDGTTNGASDGEDGEGDGTTNGADDGSTNGASGATDGAATAATEAAAEAATKPAEGELLPEGTVLTAKGSDYVVYVTTTGNSGLLKDTTLQVREITKEKDEEEYQLYYDKAVEELKGKYDDNTGLSFARFYDISFLYKGEITEPTGDVIVRIEYEKPVELAANAGIDTVHFDEKNAENKDQIRTEFIESEMKTEDGPNIKTGAGDDTGNAASVISEAAAKSGSSSANSSKGNGNSASSAGAGDATVKINEVEFKSSSFSVYGLLGAVIEKTILASDGRNYTVTVEYGSDAGIPAGTELVVEEITQDEEASDEPTVYEIYAGKACEALGLEAAIYDYARFFDISLVKDGAKIQPAEGSTVNVKIELADTDSDSLKVLHFEGDSNPETPDSFNAQSGTVTFDASGFSVYAIVDAPEPAPAEGWQQAGSIEEIAQLGSSGFYMRHPDGYYFTNEPFRINNSRTGIKKTAKTNSPENAEANGAALYYFEQESGSSDKFKVYCLSDSGDKLYIRQSGNSLSLVPADQASVFTASDFPGAANTFRMLGSDGYYWNMQGGTSGKSFAAYNAAADPNARIQLDYYQEGTRDPYGLNGKTFGIAYHNDSALSAALMAEEKEVGGKDRLAGFKTVMKPDVLDNDGILLVAEGSDISQWTFESVQGDRYYITTEVDGVKKYLTINNDQVTLTDEPDSTNSLIRAKPGTGENSGKWHFSVGNYSLNLAGSAANGFNAVTGTGATTWMNLVEKSVLNDDDFNLYTAQKVSVSDTLNVYDGQQIIIYTRVWNEQKKKYEFYAVDHDGSLIPCYDTGDKIEWVGSKVNTALWEFSEYRNPDGTLNYYYDLQNTQYGDYLAPQVSDGQILSGSPIGLNMNGRRYGEAMTEIVAWDDANYAYVGLRTENGHVVACPLDEAEDFYFAVITPVDPEDELTTVSTIDSTEYGITMKMVDFNYPIENERDTKQTEYLGLNTDGAGLVTTDLDENGYPTATGSGLNLADLYEGEREVNHLFLQSIYNESGYFEYNSTANFAHLNDDGTFTVYDQIAAIGASSGPTRTHGQFMPYNDITAGRYATVTNQTDVSQHTLPDTDPRKGEKLYLIGQNEANYFFGMEMEASFTQTANGLDEWGHDIIFEFSGDDDFWFYVDGELVLDLGGVHSAQTGSINFRTGEVKSSRGNSTLYNIFKSNYEGRGLSPEEVAQKLDDIFTQNESGQYIFKDYTNHTMKMFYMERGSGASNLHMRFNLAAVKPGTVVLSKKLSGTESAHNSVIEFPYQIYYKTQNDYGNTYHLLEEKTDGKYNVNYKGTTTHVPFKESFTPAGGTESYENCFFLNPGQSAVINLPDDTIDYYIVECGVNTSVYDQVKANNDVITGTTTGNPGRQDFATSKASMDDRPEVDYDNHVSDGAMRTLSIDKMLYDSDGQTLLHYPQDESLFSFRIYLGSENADPDDLPLANMYDYNVKDPNGNYCRWDTPTQKFVSLGKTDYDSLTEEEKKSATFTTSIYGTISKIPADYTVEIRDLIVGTQYKLEERLGEIPRGYTLRLRDGYQRIDTDPVINTKDVPISGTIAGEEDPQLRVSNQKGWGLTVQKIWTDKDFMESHDDIYFAVYLKDQAGEGDLVEGTVRRYSDSDKEIYYFFGALENGKPFKDYEIREVTLTKGPDFNVDENGVVTGYTSVTPIGEGGTLENGGKPVGGEHRDGYMYSVHYEPGEQTLQNENVRTDKVTNSRPGIEIYKEDLSGNVLAGAVFTLKDSEGQDVAASSYTSRTGDGLVTIAYLSKGTYTLDEISAPKGFVALPEPVTITIGDDNSVSVDGPTGLWRLDPNPESGMTAAITIKDRPTAFRVVKVGNGQSGTDPDSGNEGSVPLHGVHFALYRQVTDVHGEKVKDYTPMRGYEDLVTDENGIVPNVTMALSAGTYYLTETSTIDGYDLLPKDLCFTIGIDGTISIEDIDQKGWLSQETDPDTGHVAYVITIPNEEQHKVRFKKVDVAKPAESALEGAVFDLYRVVGGQRETTPMISGLTSGEDGILAIGGVEEIQLPVGVYHLIETNAPEGYYLRDDPVIVTVTHDPAPRGVSYDDGTGISQDGEGITYDEESGVYTMLISNSTGVELPASGGIGTRLFTIFGLILVTAAAAGLVFRAGRGRIHSR